MSGGSFNYLHCADLTERKPLIAAMRDELHGLGYHDAALLTGEVVSLMDRIDAAQRSLSDIWHAVEWWRSCDYGPEQVAEAVREWAVQIAEECLR